MKKSHACPPGLAPGPILCPHCLAEYRAVRLWTHVQRLTLVCPYHGRVFTLQELGC